MPFAMKQVGFTDRVNTVANVGDGDANTSWIADFNQTRGGWLEMDVGYPVKMFKIHLQKAVGGFGDFMLIGSDFTATTIGDAVQSTDEQFGPFRDSIGIGANGLPAAATFNTFSGINPVAAHRFWRLVNVGPNNPVGDNVTQAGVTTLLSMQIVEWSWDGAVVATQAGFTPASTSGPISNLVDNDQSTLWTPSASSLSSASAFPTAGANVAPGGNYPYIQLDYGAPACIGLLSFNMEKPGVMQPCRLIASNSPATSPSNSVQAGDVEILRLAQADLDANTFVETTLNTPDGLSYRYYRFVFEKGKGPTGGGIREIIGFQRQSNVYIDSDYDSIWSRGDRIANGLLTTGWYGFPSQVSPPQNAFNGLTTDRFTLGAGAVLGGAAWWWDFGYWGVELHGIAFPSDVDTVGVSGFPYTLVGGLAPGFYWPASYMLEFEGFGWDIEVLPSISPIEFSPAVPWGWAHYEIVLLQNETFPTTVMADEVWFKVAHSTLDGGDRRNIGGTRPDKQVTVTTSAGIDRVTTGGHQALSGLVDGGFSGSSLGKTVGVQLVTHGASTPVNAAGQYIQFQFPRTVRMNNLVLNTILHQETYTVPNVPDHYGIWHWEVSNDNVNFTRVGQSWSFTPGCDYMTAPRIQGGNAQTSTLFINTATYQTGTMLASGNPANTVTVHTTPASDGAQRSSQPKMHGRLYVEAQITIASAGGFGVVDGANLNFVSNHINVAQLNADGKIYANNATALAVGLGTLTGSHRIAAAFDLDAGLFWMRADGGLWNNDASADPGTGTNGLNLNNGGQWWSELYLLFWGDTAGDTCTIFPAGPFTIPPPQGFVGWDIKFQAAGQLGFSPPAFGSFIWRMVLDSGPAFGTSAELIQFVFNLTDEGDQTTFFRTSFSDGDGDGMTISTAGFTVPGDPFVVALSDGDSDGLTMTPTLTHNPVMRLDMDDGADIEFFSDLFPSSVVQVSLMTNGR